MKTTEAKEYIEPIGFEGTKGEWAFEKHHIGKYYGNIISNFGDRRQRTIDVLLRYALDEEMEANAILLSNSKELVKALQDLVDKVEKLSLWDKTDRSYYKAKEVLNKALNIQK